MNLRVCLITAAAALLIVLAVVFSVLRAVLPHATGYTAEIQQKISEQIGLPVTFESIDADMDWLVPRLRLIDFNVYNSDGKNLLIHFDEADFSLAYIDSLRQMSPIVGEISLVGADLVIEKHKDKRWTVQGIDVKGGNEQKSSSQLEDFLKNSNFSLLNSSIHFYDRTKGYEVINFSDVNFVIENSNDRHGIKVNASLPDNYGESFQFIAEIDGDIKRPSGKIFLSGKSINIKNWADKFKLNDVVDTDGTLDMQLWIDLADKKIDRATGSVSVVELVLDGKLNKAAHWDADRFATNFLWRSDDQDWSLSLSQFVLSRHDTEWPVQSNILFSNQDAEIRLAASYFRLQDLIDLPAIFIHDDRLGEVNRLKATGVEGDFYNFAVDFSGLDVKNSTLEFTVIDLGFSVPGSGLGVTGADGIFRYLDGKAEIELFSENVTLSAGQTFRQPLSASILEGTVTANKNESSWLVASSNMLVRSQDIDATARFLAQSNENGEVNLDLQANYHDAIGSSAHKYYPVSIMSDDLVGWLDKAITDGVVESGGFIFHGNLNEFPFADNSGVMEALFNVRNASLHYLDGWPNLDKLAARVRFHNASMFIENVTGESYQGEIRQATARINDLNVGHLLLDAQVTAPADGLQQFVLNSGLDDTLGGAMRRLHALGETNLEVSLGVDLSGDEAVVVDGVLQLLENEIYFPDMEYQLNKVSGDLSFTRTSLSSPGLTAEFDGKPFSISVAENNTVPASEAVFSFSGNWQVDTLLAKFDWVPRNWLKGTTDWNVAVTIPYKVDQYSFKVAVNSDLRGVDIAVSDALSKQKQQPISVNATVSVLDDALQLSMASDNGLDLYARRNPEEIWNFTIDASYIKGKGEFAQDLNTKSVVQLDLDYLNLSAMTRNSDKTSHTALSPTQFPSINAKTRTMLWDKWRFNRTRLITSWNTHGLLVDEVKLWGNSLAITGHGSWLSSWQKANESGFKFIVSSDNFGNALEGLGYKRIVDRSRHNSTIDIHWNAEPYNFSWEKVVGTAQVKMADGEIYDVDPGTGGRLVGLFNVFKLPKRFIFDFDDVSNDGFVFDTIVGDFEFLAGSATTRNVEITSSAADIKMSGRIGMEAEDYDMVMQVRPHASAATFTGGALAGGPVVGVGLVLIQKLLRLDKKSRDEYTISGSWDDPVVTQIKRREEAFDVDETVDSDLDDETY